MLADPTELLVEHSERLFGCGSLEL